MKVSVKIRVLRAVLVGQMLWAGLGSAETPHVNYMIHCQGCHLEDGAGTEGKVPAIKDFVGNFLRVPGGREYLIQVPGSASSGVDDAGLADILNWILVNLSPNEVPADFEPYTAEEVARLRVPLTHAGETRARLIDKLNALDAR